MLKCKQRHATIRRRREPCSTTGPGEQAKRLSFMKIQIVVFFIVAAGPSTDEVNAESTLNLNSKPAFVELVLLGSKGDFQSLWIEALFVRKRWCSGHCGALGTPVGQAFFGTRHQAVFGWARKFTSTDIKLKSILVVQRTKFLFFRQSSTGSPVQPFVCGQHVPETIWPACL